MLGLAIDTSTRYASIALAMGGEVRWELTWRSERNHTVELLPGVRYLLLQAGAAAEELNAVFVALGPGNFSALRVGMSVAKGLALGAGASIVGVSTFLLEAGSYLESGVPVYTVLNAGRDQVVWAVCRKEEGKLPLASDPAVGDVEDLTAAIEPPAILCGEGVGERGERLRSAVPRGTAVLGPEPPTRRAGALANLGWRRLTGGDVDDVATLQPVYARGASITASKAIQ